MYGRRAFKRVERKMATSWNSWKDKETGTSFHQNVTVRFGNSKIFSSHAGENTKPG